MRIIKLEDTINKIKKDHVISEIGEFKYTLKNKDIPLKKVQNLLRNLVNLSLYDIQEQLFLIIKKMKAAPMVIHKSKCPHRKKFIKNKYNITGGPGKFPVKCSIILLGIIKYIISMNKSLGLSGNQNAKLLILKEAFATKGTCIQSGFYKAFGNMTLKRRQKAHITFNVVTLKI